MAGHHWPQSEIVFFHNILLWKELGDWVHLKEITRGSRLELFTPIDNHILKTEVLKAIKEGYPTVVISDPFCNWPWKILEWASAEQVVKEMSALRELTRDTQDEVVFALYTHPDALEKAPHHLSNEEQKRLSRYFHIPMNVFDSKDGEEPTPDQLEKLRSNWTKVWHQIQDQLKEKRWPPLGRSMSRSIQGT